MSEVLDSAKAAVTEQPQKGKDNEAREQVDHSAGWGFFVFGWLTIATVVTIVFGLEAFGELTRVVDAPDEMPYSPKFRALRLKFDPSQDQLAVLVGASGGAIGAVAFSSWAAAVHFANNRFGASWVPWYFVRIVLGAILGGIAIMAVSAGLVTGGPADLSPMGTVVFGFVVGIAAKKAMDKFEDLIDVLLGAAEHAPADGLTAKIGEIAALHDKKLITTEQKKAQITKILSESAADS